MLPGIENKEQPQEPIPHERVVVHEADGGTTTYSGLGHERTVKGTRHITSDDRQAMVEERIVPRPVETKEG